jgi:hypothetical protein
MSLLTWLETVSMFGSEPDDEEEETSMSLQSGSLGRFWLGPQTAKGTAATTYYGFKGNMIDLAPQQMTRNIGQLVGGSYLPGGSVKTAAFGGGSIVMPPALDDYIGWLLYAFAGSVTSNDLTDYHEHYFPSGADDTAPGKYLTGRRSIPGTATEYEQMEDLVPTRITLGLTPGEFATLRMDLLGRTISAPDGSSWTYAAKNPEDSCPIVCKGGLEMPDGTGLATATGATLDLVNVVPDLRQVLVVGDYYPFDFPVLTRAITLTYTNLYETNDLYANFYWSGTAWTPVVYSTSLDVYVESPDDISGASEPYELKVWASDVDWQCEPLRLAGGELIGMQVVGAVTDAANGHDWYFRLRNATSEYDWPS